MTSPAETSDTPQRDYRKTLNLTLSDRDPGAFPQRGNLPIREKEFHLRWDEMHLYRKNLTRPASKGTYILHDGPPYSNGNIHLGHALNKIAKDIVTRSRSMFGFAVPYVPGWDNHGMPIENAVVRSFREAGKTPDRVTLRRACRKYAQKWVNIQREQFKRLGIWGDWDHPYLTMDSGFESKIVEVFGEMATDGYIYRGLRPVLWCPVCETALADAEVEYDQHISNSIYIRFPLKSDPNGVLGSSSIPVYAAIWTTTPWTIPANLALAVHPDAEYALVNAEIGSERALYLIALPLVEATMGIARAAEFQIVRTIRGSDLENIVFSHPLFDRPSPILLASYVTMDTGTGIVHTAPGHGKEDFETGKQYGLEVLNPVDSSGRFTVEAGAYQGKVFAGLRVVQAEEEEDAPANIVLIEALHHSGHLLNAGKYEHTYPHCWRCHSPLIFRATVQWFMSIDHKEFRQRALEEIQSVKWFPKESVNRITNMVSGRPDWCVSRQRSWGVGIPAFYCEECGDAILTKESVQAVADMVKSETSDAWYMKSPSEILPSGFGCPHCGAAPDRFRKETDVLDVWFDSGSSNRAVLESPDWPELSWPADLYLEGGDQHRGWFNSSLMVAASTRGGAPYKAVVTNGWTLDENGEAMHKSKGNVVDPLAVVEKYGADVVRWWVVSQDFMEDTRCGENLLKQVSEMYRRVRNTFRFLLNNLYDFDPYRDTVPASEMVELDRWALAKFANLTRTCISAYEQFEFHRVYQAALNFCATDLSSFYLDVLKDRLYASKADSRERRSAQTALHELASGLARLLAPILVHTSEEVWDYLKLPGKAVSVHLAGFPSLEAADEELIADYECILEVRDAVQGALETSRQAGVIGNPLEAKVTLKVPGDILPLLQSRRDQLSSLFLVSQTFLQTAKYELEIETGLAEGAKCARCWLVKEDVGKNLEHPALCNRCIGAVTALFS